MTTLRKSYPSQPFRKDKSSHTLEEEGSASVVSGTDVLQVEKGATQESTMLAGIAEVPSPVKDMGVPLVEVSAPLAEYAKEFAEKVMEDSLQHYREYVERGEEGKTAITEIPELVNTEAVPSDVEMSETVTATATETTELSQTTGTTHSLSQLPTDNQYALPEKMKSEIIIRPQAESSTLNMRRACSVDATRSLRRLSIDSRQSSGLRKGLKHKASHVMNTLAILQAFRKSTSQQQPRKKPGPGMPLVQHHITLSRRLELLQAQPPSPSESRLHRHRSRVSTSLMSHAEFFERNHSDVLGEQWVDKYILMS